MYRSRFDTLYQLDRAIAQEDLNKVDRLLDHGFDVDDLPWNWISESNNVFVFLMLQAHGYPIDHAAVNKDSALLHSIARNDVAMVSFLLDHGVNPNEDWNKNAFVSAVTRIDDTQKCLSMFRVLFEHGVMPVNQDSSGDTSLMCCSVREDCTPLINALLDHDAEIDFWGPEGNTALHRAVERENVTACSALLARRANPNIVNYRMETPLLLAVMAKNHAIIDVLLQAGANPSIRTNDGETTLQYAKKQEPQDYWIIRKLKKYGAME